MDKVLFVLDAREIPVLEEFLKTKTKDEQSRVKILALGADIELVLHEKKIEYISGDKLRSVSHFDCFRKAEEIGREVLLDSSFSFFSYRNISIAEVLLPSLQIYLLSVLYYLDIFTNFIERNSDCKEIILLPDLGAVSELGGVLDELGIKTAYDAASAVAVKYAILVTIATLKAKDIQSQVWWETTLFRTKRWMFGVALSFLNSAITILRKPKSIRILASDYWKHLDPLMREISEGELVLLDRAEALKISFATIWKHRMRFVHIENYLSTKDLTRASVLGKSFVVQWMQTKGDNKPLKNASFRGVTLESFLQNAIPLLLGRGGKRAVSQIDGTFALYEPRRPNIVLVRASFSVQMHFPIMCHVAKQFGIPAIELQHGLLYLGSGTFIHNPSPEYIATYGSLTSAGFKTYGYTDDKLLNIGSPRFDDYKAMRQSAKMKDRPFTITFIIPAVLPHSWSDAYEVRQYIRGIAEATAAIPNALALCKLRPQDASEEFYRRIIPEAFGATPYRIEQYRPLVNVIGESDAVVTIYSTTVLEGLISGRPLIYNGSLEYHQMLGKEFIRYAEAGAMLMVSTTEQLKEALVSLANDTYKRKMLVKNADSFMAENYSFDGNASARLANTIRALAK